MLAILGAVSLHFQSETNWNGEIWREGMDLDTLPALNFVKIAQGICLTFLPTFQNFHDF